MEKNVSGWGFRAQRVLSVKNLPSFDWAPVWKELSNNSGLYDRVL